MVGVQGLRPNTTYLKKSSVAESSYECQFCTYPKVSLSPSFKNSIKEDSYPKPATSNFSVFKTRSRIGTDVIALKSFN